MSNSLTRRDFIKTLALSLSAVPVLMPEPLKPLHWVKFDSLQKAHMIDGQEKHKMYIIDSEGRVLKLPATLVEGNRYQVVLDK